jgi:tetratricopeptide (TPR) repeat protein
VTSSSRPNNVVSDLLQKAVALHQAGRFAEAEKTYDQVLKRDAANPDALNLKGVIVNELGRHVEAIALYDRALAAFRNFPEAHYNKGLALTALERNEAALQSYLQAIQLRPAYIDARLNAGILLHKMARTEDAIGVFGAMTQLFPNEPRGFYNLGACLAKLLPGAKEEDHDAIAKNAAEAFDRALALDPRNPEIHYAYAGLHSFRGEYASAIEHHETALKLNPKWSDDLKAEALSDLGELLRKEKRYPEAVDTHRRAVALRPQVTALRFNLATALYDAGSLDEAEEIYTELVRTQPDFVRPYVNLANIYRDRNRHEDAISMQEQALSIAPSFHPYTNIAATLADLGWLITSLMVHDKAVSLKSSDPGTRFNRSIAILNTGRLAAGWPDYDLRFDVPAENNPRRPAPPAYWQGEDLSGKTILVWTEQGLGDEILHASILPELIARADRLIVECSTRLAPVLARSFPAATVVARHYSHVPVTPPDGVDYQIPVASLGRHFRNDLAQIPKHHGYLKPDPEKVAKFRRAYEERAQGRRIVGIAWRSKHFVYGISKSAHPTNMGAFLKLPGVMFVNLQYGDCAEELAAVRSQLGIEIYQDPDVNPRVDMDIFFAQVAAMDLVISTSNTTVHVAGSLNVPTWMLLPNGKGALWYWFLRREDSPWYPSLKLIRASRSVPDRPWEEEPAAIVGERLPRWISDEIPQRQILNR